MTYNRLPAYRRKAYKHDTYSTLAGLPSDTCACSPTQNEGEGAGGGSDCTASSASAYRAVRFASKFWGRRILMGARSLDASMMRKDHLGDVSDITRASRECLQANLQRAFVQCLLPRLRPTPTSPFRLAFFRAL